MSSNYSASIPKCPHEQQFYDSHYCSRSRYSSKKNKLLRTIVAGSTARVASALTSTQVIEGAARLSQEMWEVIWAQSGWHERARGAGYPFPSASSWPIYATDMHGQVYLRLSPPAVPRPYAPNLAPRPAPPPLAQYPPNAVAGPSNYRLPPAALPPLAPGWSEYTSRGRTYWIHNTARTVVSVRPTATASSVASSTSTSRPRSRSPPRHRSTTATSSAAAALVSRRLQPTPVDPRAQFRAWIADFYSLPALQRDEEGRCTLVISRDSLLQHGYNEVMKYQGSDMKKLLVIRFHGEDGDDAGGLSKEFFHLLSQEMFSPNYGLFRPGILPYTTEINPYSELIDPDHHLQHFKLFGRIVALSIFHKRLIDVHFMPTFYKGMLGLPVKLEDLKEIDPDLHKSLTWTLNNDITDVLDDETFSFLDETPFGEKTTVPICPNGEYIQLSNANKASYVRQMVQAKTMGRIQKQFDSFMVGFKEIIDPVHLRKFSPAQLDALIAGSAELDVDDWERHTELNGHTKTDKVIKDFFKLLRSFDNETRTKFLFWATGSTRIPSTGFKDLRGGGETRLFNITTGGTTDHLPQAHACFNRIDLPRYTSYDMLERKIRLAMTESSGFERE